MGAESIPHKHGHPRFYELLESEADLHSRKNRDYTGAHEPLNNLRRCEIYGVPAYIGVLVRLSDKYSREETLALSEPSVASEGFVDVQRDKSVYSKLEQILYEEFQTCPYKEEILGHLSAVRDLLRAWRYNPCP